MNGEKRKLLRVFTEKFTMNTIHTIGNRLSSTIRRAFSTIFPAIFLKFLLVYASGAVQSCWNSAKTRRFHDVHTLCWMYFHHTIVGLLLHSVQCWRCVVVGRQARHGEKWKVWMNDETRGMKSRKLWIITRTTLWCVEWGPPLYDLHAVCGKSVKIILKS